MLIEIFGKDINSELDFHKQFNKYAEWTYYGYNLNALWDVLSGGFSGHLVWYDSSTSQERLGNTFFTIIEMFEKTHLMNKEMIAKYPENWTSDDEFNYELK